MNDMLINMVASQLGIKPDVLAELKATRPVLLAAKFFRDDRLRIEEATLTVDVKTPTESFLVVITLPVALLKRLGPVYESAVKLARKE